MTYSIVIVSFNCLPQLIRCIDSIHNHSKDYEIIVVDNNTQDGGETQKYLLGSDLECRLCRENEGYSKACNMGADMATGKYIVFLNPDTIVTAGWLEGLRKYLFTGIGAVGPVSNYVAGLQKYELYTKEKLDIADPTDPDGMAQILAFIQFGKGIETKLLIGFCIMMRIKYFRELTGMDEDLFLGNDDLELSWQIRDVSGLSLLIATDVFIYHEGRVSFKTLPDVKTKRLIQESTDALYKKMSIYYNSYDLKVPAPQDLWGINWFRPTKLVSIIILGYNNVQLTRECIDSIKEHTEQKYELILIDNASSDNTADYFSSLPNVTTIINKENQGIATGWNQGIKLALGDYILVLNNDTIVTPGWLENMIDLAESDEQIGIIGPRSNNISGPQVIENTGIVSKEDILSFSQKWVKENKGSAFQFDRITGFCMLISREAFEKVGYFDEQFDDSPEGLGKGNYEDDDYCIRARQQGFKLMIANDSFVYHFCSASYTVGSPEWKELMEVNGDKYRKKHGITI